ncbi:acyltransferase family protein [Fibrella arboris]|uniref:acyltransferase family protein n=1 Tax=Fibrella arboris TaxID=3242486 RepID=UPI003522158A
MPLVTSPPATQLRLHGLDHLRALAITLVFFFHYQLGYFGHPDWVSTYATFGWTGVDLFFVLSGFLVSSHLFEQVSKQKTIQWSAYAGKRFFRIMPAYLLVVVVYFTCPFFREKEGLPPLWTFLTFTQNTGLNVRDAGTFSHAWSLCVEVHFYLALPLFVSLVVRNRRVSLLFGLLGLLVVGGFLLRSQNWNRFYLPAIGSRDEYVNWYQYVYYPTYNRLDGLLVGVAIAGVASFLPSVWNRLAAHGNWFLGLGLSLLTGAYFLCENEQSYAASVAGFPLVALGYGLLVTAAVLPSGVLSRSTSRFTAFMARISYALYLSHKGVIHVTQTLLSQFSIDTSNSITLLISIGSCTLIATLIYYVVELPVLAWYRATNR